MGKGLPYEGKVSIHYQGLPPAHVEWLANEVPAGAIKVPKGYTEAIVYRLVRSIQGGGYERGRAEQSLYLYASGDGTLPPIESAFAYLAIYLKGARLDGGGQPGGLDVRGILDMIISEVVTGGPQPTGPGPTHSYP